MFKIWEDKLYPQNAKNKTDLKTWQGRRKKIITEVGGLASGFRSEMLLRGYPMIKEMTGKITFIQGWVLAITGRLPNKKEDRLLNAMFINTALADPRFWFNRVARLGATVKTSPAACMAAGILTDESEFFATGAFYDASKFFEATLTEIKKKANLENIIKSKLNNREIISGFGRMFARGKDERNSSLLKVSRKCNFHRGKYLKLAFEIEHLLQKNKNSQIYLNYGGLASAILLDLGFNPVQIMLFITFLPIIGRVANIAEAYERPPGEFLPLSCDDIEYIGHSFRVFR
ncbi:MAG: hypothetical protein LLF28_06020 [Nitrospiraceae bacterium]|nr:hypothetical protein [Nitrospiraceae bacterium]